MQVEFRTNQVPRLDGARTRMLPPPPFPAVLLEAAAAASMVTVNTECDREESWFMSVAPTERLRLPTCATGR